MPSGPRSMPDMSNGASPRSAGCTSVAIVPSYVRCRTGCHVQEPSIGAVAACVRVHRHAPVLLGALVAAGCGSSSAPRPPAKHADPPAPRHAAAAAQPVRLALASTQGLPAPVQLPALASDGRARVLAAGGLSAADVSVPDVVRLHPGRPARAAELPVAVHDAAAAIVGGSAYVFGGGTSSGSSAAIVRVAGGRSRVVGRLPTGLSDVEAATIGDTAYVVGGYTG